MSVYYNFKIIDLTDPVFYELTQFKGELFNKWLNQWNNLSLNEKDICTHPVILISWLKNFHRKLSDECKIFIFYKDDQFVTAIPFQVAKKDFLFFKVYYLIVPYDHDLHSFGSSIAVDKINYVILFNTIFKNIDINSKKIWRVVFKKVDDSNLILKSVLNRNLFCNGYRSILNVCQGYENIINQLSKHFSRNLRRLKKKIESLPGIKYESFQENSKDIFDMYNRFVEMEASGWKGKSKTAIKLDQDIYNFYNDLVNQLSHSKNLILNFLSADGKDLASQFCLLFNHNLYILKIAYNEEYSKMAPGYMLLLHTLENLSKYYNLNCVNLMTSGRWQTQWEPELQKTYCLEIFPNSYKGILAKMLFFSFKQRIKIYGKKFGILN